MTAPALLFRFRVFIFVLLYLLGFFPPWDFRHGDRGTLWLQASTLLARSGLIELRSATFAVTIAALGCLLGGAILRVWGTAYLGSGIMRGSAMQGEAIIAAGPFRYVRNPLYLGAWLLALGTSILMPPGGAAFFLLAFSMFALFLISAEECFLSAKLGDTYQRYRRLVPQLVPRLPPRLAPAGFSLARPHWLQAALAETYPIAFTVCFAIFTWRYNAHILIQCLLVCYGLSLITRAMTTRAASAVD